MSTLSFKIAKLGSVLGALAAVHATRSNIETFLLIGGFVSAVSIWVVLQVRDYKPNRRLRGDNGELRTENDDLRRRLDDAENERRKLAASRDFDTSLAVVMKELAEARERAAAEHRAILEEIQESRRNQHETWSTFHQQLASLTSAIQVVASGILSDAAASAPTAVPQ